MSRASCVVGCLAALGLANSAGGQVLFSPDITVELGPVSTAVVADEELAYDDALGSVLPIPSLGLPPEADVIGYEPLPGGDALLSFDTTVSLPGLAAAEPRDVVRYDSGTGLYALELDGSALLPAGVQIDAIGVDVATGDLLLSFDKHVLGFPAGAVADEDVVRISGLTMTMVFDGSANGIDEALDVDAVSTTSAPILLLSFDGTGTVAGLTFDDEDVVRFDTGTFSFSLFFDGGLSDPVAWPAADLVALPEPTAGLFAGLALLVLLARQRGR